MARCRDGTVRNLRPEDRGGGGHDKLTVAKRGHQDGAVRCDAPGRGMATTDHEPAPGPGMLATTRTCPRIRPATERGATPGGL